MRCSFTGGAVGSISAFFAIEIQNFKEQEKKLKQQEKKLEKKQESLRRPPNHGRSLP